MDQAPLSANVHAKPHPTFQSLVAPLWESRRGYQEILLIYSYTHTQATHAFHILCKLAVRDTEGGSLQAYSSMFSIPFCTID